MDLSKGITKIFYGKRGREYVHWRVGVLVGFVLGVVAVVSKEMLPWLWIIPAKVANILAIAHIPLDVVDSYVPLLIYAPLFGVLGWLYTHRNELFTKKLYQENRFATFLVIVLFMVPAVALAGNAGGLWCAGCGYGRVEATITNPSGQTLGAGEAYCILRDGIYMRQDTDYRGRCVFPPYGQSADVEAGESYELVAFCTNNPMERDSTMVAVRSGEIHVRTFTLSCGGACVPTVDRHHMDCYNNDRWWYNDCNVRSEPDPCPSGQVCREISNQVSCASSGGECNYNAVCDAGEDWSSCPSDCSPPVSCNHECLLSELNSCIGNKRCTQVWDNAVAAYCRKLTADTVCGSSCTNECSDEGLCKSNYRCGDADDDPCLEWYYDASCVPASTTIPCVDTCAFTGCIGDYVCGLGSDGCRHQVFDSSCAGHITTTTPTTTTPTTTTTVSQLCNLNGVCEADKGETKYSCQDCVKETDLEKYGPYMGIGGVLALIAFIIRKKRK